MSMALKELGNPSLVFKQSMATYSLLWVRFITERTYSVLWVRLITRRTYSVLWVRFITGRTYSVLWVRFYNRENLLSTLG